MHPLSRRVAASEKCVRCAAHNKPCEKVAPAALAIARQLAAAAAGTRVPLSVSLIALLHSFG